MLNPACVADKKQIDFEPALIEGASCDCGGNLYHFINNNKLKLGKFKDVTDIIPNFKDSLSEEMKQYIEKDEEFARELKQDVQFIKEKFDVIVPEYRIPE